MAYTAEQQNRINAASAQVKAAVDAYDSAVEARDTFYNNARIAYNKPDVGSECYFNQPTFEAQILHGQMSVNSCKKKLTGAPKCERCWTTVKEYNINYDGYRLKIEEVQQLAAAVDTAKRNLQNVINAVAQEVKNDPSFILQQQEIEKEGDIALAAQRQKWTVFAVIAVLIVVIVGFVYLRFIRKTV